MTKESLIPKDSQEHILRHFMSVVATPAIEAREKELEDAEKAAIDEFLKSNEAKKLAKKIEEAKQVLLDIDKDIWVDFGPFIDVPVKADNFVNDMLGAAARREVDHMNLPYLITHLARGKILEEARARLTLLTIGNFDDIIESLKASIDIKGIIESFVITKKNDD